jgi:hypothetical protein
LEGKKLPIRSAHSKVLDDSPPHIVDQSADEIEVAENVPVLTLILCIEASTDDALHYSGRGPLSPLFIVLPELPGSLRPRQYGGDDSAELLGVSVRCELNLRITLTLICILCVTDCGQKFIG